MNGKKIAVFIPSLRGGGAERAMLLLCEGFANLGYDVDLLVASATGPLRSLVPPTVRLINFDKRRIFKTLWPLRKYLKEECPAALYSTIAHTNVIAILAKCLSGVKTPVIVRESNSPMSEPKLGFTRRIAHFLASRLYPKARAVVAVSNGVAKELAAMNYKLAKSITVLPTPVVSGCFLADALKNSDHPWLDKNFGYPLIVAAGRLHPQKDFATLLRAFQKVRGSSTAHLIILGEGAMRGDLEDLAVKLGIKPYVSMPGFILNPLPYFSGADVFVLSSKYEGMPNVLVQAMACGTPVVSTDCPSGPSEVLQGGRWGRLVAIGDWHAMADAIGASMKEELPAKAREHVFEYYSCKAAARAYLALAGLAAEISESLPSQQEMNSFA